MERKEFGRLHVSVKNLLGPHSKSCPTRALIDQLADKWAILVLLAVASGPIRFNALKRVVDGVTQKMLGQTLRRLEWNGIVHRRVHPTIPVSVEYELTDLGRTLMPVVEGLRRWSMDHISLVETARSEFEAKHGVEREASVGIRPSGVANSERSNR